MNPRFLLPLLLCLSFLPCQAHEHLNAGALSKAPGSPLFLANAADYAATSGYVFGLDAGESGTPYEGYYYTGDLVLAALAATPPFGGPEPLAPAVGSVIEGVVETVSGPRGASLGFWETSVDEVDSTTISWSVPVGLNGGTNRIRVSESNGTSGSDPYGHRHGRLYSVTQPGFYQVSFRFVDASTNGPSGGPIHTPSDRFVLNLQAGVTLAGISSSTNGTAIVFGAPANLPDTGAGTATQYQLEVATTLGTQALWKAAGDVVVGDDHMHTNTVSAGPTAQFFRLTTQEGQ